LFIDTGRTSYGPTEEGRYGRSAAAHNAVMIDGREPFASRWLNGHRLMHPDYLKARASASISQESFQMQHDGFARLPDAGPYRRSFRLDTNAVTIEDRFEGTDSHKVAVFFHLAPDFSARRTPGAVVISKQGNDAFALRYLTAAPPVVDIVRGGRWPDGSLAGWGSRRYGERRPLTSVRFETRSLFPCSNIFRIEAL
jgi:hypothetical protein